MLVEPDHQRSGTGAFSTSAVADFKKSDEQASPQRGSGVGCEVANYYSAPGPIPEQTGLLRRSVADYKQG